MIGQIDEFVKKGDIISAQGLAVKIFGARGAGLVDAAVQGKLSLQELSKTFTTTGDGIITTAGKTSTLSGKLGVLKNQAKLALAEFGTPVLKLFLEALTPLLPIVEGLSKGFDKLPGPLKTVAASLLGIAITAKLLSGPLGLITGGFRLLTLVIPGLVGGLQLLWGVLLANPWIIVALLAIAAIALIITHWEDFKRGLSIIWENIKGTAATVWNSIKDFFVQWWPELLGIMTGGIGLVVGLIIQNWTEIKTWTVNAFNDVVNFIAGVPGMILGALAGLGGLLLGLFIDAVHGVFGAVTGGFNDVVSFVASIPGRILGALGDLGSLLWDAGVKIIKGLINGAKSVIGDVKNFFVDLAKKIFSWKGPPEKDEILLAPAGRLIVRSIVKGGQPELGYVEAFFRGPVTDAIRIGTKPFVPPLSPMLAASAGGATAGAMAGRGGDVNLNFYGPMTVRSDEDLVQLQRGLQHEVDHTHHTRQASRSRHDEQPEPAEPRPGIPDRRRRGARRRLRPGPTARPTAFIDAMRPFMAEHVDPLVELVANYGTPPSEVYEAVAALLRGAANGIESPRANRALRSRPARTL